MNFKRITGVAAALLLALTMAGTALAVDPSDSTDVSLTINAGSQFSVDITNSNNFPSRTFSLGATGNYSYSAFYNLQVVDLRGTGAGWNVTASGSAFTPAVPGSGLPTVNNGLYWLACAAATGFCADSGSISDGVSVVAGSPDIIAAPGSIFKSSAGTTAAPSPYGTGTFSTQEVVYYTGFPNALAVGTYTTTVTLTLSGTAP